MYSIIVVEEQDEHLRVLGHRIDKGEGRIDAVCVLAAPKSGPESVGMRKWPGRRGECRCYTIGNPLRIPSGYPWS